MSIGIFASSFAGGGGGGDSGGVAGWGDPVYWAHRGAMNIYPEHTQEAYDYATGAGYPIELDVIELSDGDWAVIHDTTATRTTTSTSTISTLDRSGFLALSCDADSWWGTFSGTPTLMTLDQVLDRYGQTTTYLIELKGGSASNLTTFLDTYAWAADYVVLQSFDRTTCNTFAADGYITMFLCPNTTVASSNPASSLLASGIEWVCCAWNMSQTTIETYVTNGMEVGVYTVNSQHERARLVSAGVRGFFTDDPVYVSGDTATYRRTTDPYDQSTYWPGHVGWEQSAFEPGNTVTARGRLNTTEDRLLVGDDGSGTVTVLAGWMCPLPSPSGSYTITLTMEYVQVTDSSRWGGVYFAMNSDATQPENVSGATNDQYPDGYLVLLRGNGGFNLYRMTNGAGTLLDSTTTTAITAGNTASLQIDVTPTAVSVERTDTSDTISSSDTTYRGEWVFFRASRPSNDAIDVEFYDVTLS